MPVGDVNSNAIGSGARYNDGKPDMALLPLMEVAEFLGAPRSKVYKGPSTEDTIFYIGMYQRRPDTTNALWAAIDSLYSNNRVLALQDAARVFEYGKRKYAAWNWAKGMAWSIPVACAVRHVLAIEQGEELDPESGLPHSGHVVCNLLMLAVFFTFYPQGNDLGLNQIVAAYDANPEAAPVGQFDMFKSLTAAEREEWAREAA